MAASGVGYGGGVFWVVAWVGVVSAGLAVLAVCAVKVFAAVHCLGRELDRTRRRLQPEYQTLQGELRTLQEGRTPQTTQDGVRSS
jgi:hypothetical protein